MPYTKEQLKAYYEANKAELNRKRAERRRLIRLGQIKKGRVETAKDNIQVETVLEVGLPKQVETGLRQNNSLEVETTLPKEKVETPQLENIGLRQVETAKEVSQPKKEVETDKQVETIKLWSDYYLTKKPCCFSCQTKGIKENEYAFCSTAKKPTLIYNEWGKLIHTFNNIYACNVYHWTICQGQNKKEASHE